MSVCRLSRFDNDRLLSFVSCLQITHDAIYFTYKPSRGSSPSDTVQPTHVHDFGAHNPPDVDVTPVVDEPDMEDGFEGGWEDEDSEDDDPLEFAIGAEGQYLRHLPSPASCAQVVRRSPARYHEQLAFSHEHKHGVQRELLVAQVFLGLVSWLGSESWSEKGDLSKNQGVVKLMYIRAMLVHVR